MTYVIGNSWNYWEQFVLLNIRNSLCYWKQWRLLETVDIIGNSWNYYKQVILLEAVKYQYKFWQNTGILEFEIILYWITDWQNTEVLNNSIIFEKTLLEIWKNIVLDHWMIKYWSNYSQHNIWKKPFLKFERTFIYLLTKTISYRQMENINTIQNVNSRNL